MKSIYAKNSEQLDSVINYIHDCWFSLSKVNFDKENSIVRIGFEKEGTDILSKGVNLIFARRVEIPIVECVLNIHDAESVDIEDTEKIDKYDFNELRYDAQNGLISISTGIPVKFDVKVKKLNITVDTTSKVLGSKKVWRFF